MLRLGPNLTSQSMFRRVEFPQRVTFIGYDSPQVVDKYQPFAILKARKFAVRAGRPVSSRL